MENTISPLNSLKCYECDKEFTKSSKLARHLILHDTPRPFTCDVCGKSFIRKANLDVHKRIHETDITLKKPFVCTEPGCLKRFGQKWHLKNHMQIHLAPKSFVCSFEGCNEAFSKQFMLRNHQVVHTGKHAFLCTFPECDKSFKSKQALEKHISIHLGEKNYHCGHEGCGATFLKWSELQSHMKEMHTCLQCPLCLKSFTRRHGLNLHMKTHDPGYLPSVSCIFQGCGKVFTSVPFLSI